MAAESDPLVVFSPSGKRGRFPQGTPVLQAARSLGLLGRADGYEVAVKYLRPSVWVRRNIAAERGITPDDPQIDIDINNMRSLAAKALGDIGLWKAAGHLQKILSVVEQIHRRHR